MKQMNRRSITAVIGLATVAGAMGVLTPASAATAVLALSPSLGDAGSKVTVTGTGFPAKTKGSITGGSATVYFTTNNSGAFSALVTIPPAASGAVSLKATAGTGVASASFTVNAPVAQVAAAAAVASSVPPVSSAALRFGITTPGGAQATAELNAAATLVNENSTIVTFYKDFQQAPPIADLESVHARGATPMITWEPWIAGAGVNQSAYTLSNIIAGNFDTYLTNWGQQIAAWGKPVMLRFAHEMNGDWYPWSERVNGNAAGQYILAWRKVHAVLTAAGAKNISWVWAPNAPYWGSTTLSTIYPGDAYVDVVALDGYNWGTTQSWGSTWQSPSALFGDGLAQLRSIAPGKPIQISEVGCAELGGSKSAWITDLFSYLDAQPDVYGIVWFHHNKEVDWRIDSSASAAAAFTNALVARS